MKSTNRKTLGSIVSMAVVILLISVSAFAQSQTATANGTSAVNNTEFPDGVPAVESKGLPKQAAAVSVDPETTNKPSGTETNTLKIVKPANGSEFSTRSKPEPSGSAAQSDSDDSGWHFAIAPYFFTSGISGTIGARGRSVEVDASFGNVWENLDVGFMGTFEARKGKFIFVNDLVWTKLSAERDTPGGLYSTAKVGINLFIFDPEIGYRVVESKSGSLDVLGGVRIWSVENNVNLTTGTLPGFDVSERKTWAAPVVGVHGIGNLTSKFFLTGKFDIGGAGIGADLTTQLYGGAGYRVTKNTAIIGGYRWLQVDYDDSEGFLFDTQMSGLIFGAKFSF